MTTIIKHLPTDKNYILIGTGYGAYKTSKSTPFIANRLPRLEEGEIPMVAVCDENGILHWLHSEEIQIIEINGNNPSTIL